MNRREMIGALGLGAAALTLTDREARGYQDHEHEHAQGHNEHIRIMGECAMLCNEAAHHCLQHLGAGKGDLQHLARAHELTMDCQSFCVLTAELMSRSSPLTVYAHQACADACRDCAAVCDKADEEHKILHACAAKCRECETACRAMIAHGTEHDHHAGAAEPGERPATRGAAPK
jgi:hypothetical protein